MNVPVKIPEHTHILIEAGQKVDFSTPLLKSKGKKSVHIPLAQMMGFDPDKIFLRLKRGIGDSIQRGDLLAEHKTVFSTKKYLSSVSGILKEINHTTGSLIIEQESDEEALQKCYFTGEIEAIYDGYLELKVEKAHKVITAETVPYLGAGVYYLDENNTLYSEDEINGKCVFAVEVPLMDHSKIEALGGQGLILKKPLQATTGLKQIVLSEDADFDHVKTERYAYCIVGPEPQTLYFYQ